MCMSLSSTLNPFLVMAPSALPRSLCVWMGGDVFRCFIRVYSSYTDLHLCGLLLQQKSDRIGRLVPPTAVDRFNETLFCDICQRQRNVQLPAEVGCQPHILAQQFEG